MSIQHVKQLLLQALIELEGGGPTAESPPTLLPTLLPTPPLAEASVVKRTVKKKIDRSGHESHILGRNAPAICQAIFAIQRDDEENGRPNRSLAEMHEALLAAGHQELFVFGDVTRQIRQVRRVKSMNKKNFGGVHEDKFLILLPLGKRKQGAPKLVTPKNDDGRAQAAKK